MSQRAIACTQVEVGGVSVVMWDLGGQAKIRSLWEHYMKDATGLVFVVDSSDVSRLSEGKHQTLLI
jgi:GTPase SAR1 family protein